MTVPATREEFKQFCLRKLGHPAIKINVTELQVDDRVDEALNWWQEFSSDASERTYFTYVLQQADINNGYVILPENVIGVVKIFDPADSFNVANIFNIRYQIALNDLYTLTSVSMAPYFMAFQHIQLLEQLLVGLKPIRYNRVSNRCYIDTDLGLYGVGYFLVFDCYQVIDPDTFPAMWANRSFQRLATTLIKQQWGTELKKFGNVMVGGVTFNGQKIYDEATAELRELEGLIRSEQEVPPEVMIG